MTDPAPKPRRRRKFLLIGLGSVVLLLLVGIWYTTTSSFQNYVRQRMIEELERISGGRAEIGSFHVVPFQLQVEVRDITIHGAEPQGDLPLFHADHLVAQVKVISFLRTEFGFYSLSLEHPVVHVAVAPDGTTNIPVRKALAQSRKDPIDQLFALSIDHLYLRNGQLLWADRQIPLDLNLSDTRLQMDYSFLRGRYESLISLGKVDTALQDFRPFSWSTSVDFSLGTNAADVRSWKWNSGRSQLKASGRISNFRNPHFDGTYDAHLDLEELGAIARRHDLREGVAEFKGTGNGDLEQFATNGTLALRDLGWQDDQIAIKKANATTDYSVTDDQIKLSKMQAKLFSGSMAGDAQIDNWLHNIPPVPTAKVKKGNENLPVMTAARPPAKKGEKSKLPGVQTGTTHFRLRDISAAEVTAALTSPAHPLGEFRPAGVASGTVDVNWKGSFNDADAAFALDVTPPARPAPGDLPVTARIQGLYHAGDQSLQLAQFVVSTPSSRVQAAGIFSPSSTVKFSIATSNLEEWRPLVRVLGGPTNLPFRVNGDATFNGSVGGTFSSPALNGTLVAQDFEFTLPPGLHTTQQSVHWDSLAAIVRFSPQELDLRGGSLRSGETSADFEIHATLQSGQFSENSPYSARVNLHNVDVASTTALVGFDYPVTGTADASLQISGTRANPQVQGHIHATNASAYGESIENLDADLRVTDGETALNAIHLTHQDASVGGSVAFTPATRNFQIDIKGEHFDLARIRQIHLDELPFDGRADFTLKGSGTIDSPALDAAVHVRDFTVDRERSGDLYLDATTRNGETRVSGHSEFTQGSLTVDGKVAISGDYPAVITAKTDHVDLDALWRAYLGQQLTGHSDVVATVTLQGPLRYPRRWTLTGDASSIAVEVEHAKLHNEGPVRFVYSDLTANIDPVRMLGDGTDITGHGSIHFAGSREVDLTADGTIDLKLLSAFDPDLSASGSMVVHTTVDGPLDRVLPHGTIAIQNGSATYAGLPSGLSEINGSLNFTRDRIHIDQLTARTGGGTLDLKGDATRYNNQLNFNLTALGKEVRLRYPPGVSSTGTAELHWIGTPSASTVSGDILVTKLAVTPGFDFGSYLEHTRQAAGITPANSPLYNVKLDVGVRTAPDLQMKTAVARLSGDADLRVRGSLARPSVLGRAEILEGDATFNGIKFRLERGDITFANPVAIEPQVNLQATTHVRNYDLDVTVTGTPDRLNINYRSEPPLPKSDIIALLALGRTSEESEQLQQQSGQTLFSDEATNLIINQAINQTVSSRMQKLFGVSRIKIDPQGLTTETNPTARGPQITIEQEFANNISLTYSTNVSQNTQQIIQGEYYFNRNVSVVGTRDQNGVVSFDVRVRRRRK